MSTERPDKAYVHRPLLWFLAAAVLLVCLIVGALWYRHAAADWAVEAALERIRAAGEPVTLADLRALYEKLPGDPEAATLYLNAFDLLEKAPFTQHEMDILRLPIVGDASWEAPRPGEPWEWLKRVEQFLEENAEALAILHEVASRGHPARYEFDPNYGSFPSEVKAAGFASRALALEAEVRLYQGDPDGAAESAHAILMVGRSHESKFALDSLFGAANFPLIIDSTALSSVPRILEDGGASTRALIQLQADLRNTDSRESLRLALFGRRVDGIRMFRKSSFSGVTSVGGGHWIQATQRDFASYLLDMEQLVNASQLPWPKALDVASAITKRQSHQNKIPVVDVTVYNLSSDLIGFLYRCFWAACEHSCESKVADTAIAVQLYSRRHGRYPERLDQLVPEFLPEVPEDPFLGEPLRYVVEENGYAVYSVGQDGIDDGGRRPSGLELASYYYNDLYYYNGRYSHNTGGRYDIVFRVTKPPSK